MLRIIGKVTLINNERYFFKNYYMDNLDIEPVFNDNENVKKERHLSKYKTMIEYINNKSIDDFKNFDKPCKMIFKNIFIQGDDYEKANNNNN